MTKGAPWALANGGGVFRVPSLIALLVLIAIAAIASPVASDGSRIFFQLGNLTDILRQVSLIGIISLGMTFVILTGGIDLSVGSVLALATALVASALVHGWTGGPPWLRILAAIAIAVLACGAVGALNGLAIARLKVQPFIVTLAAMIGVRGFAKWFTGNENIDIGFGRDVAAQFADLFREKSVVIGAYAVLALFFWVLLSKTVFGRHVRAIGDNPTASVYAGLPILKTQLWVYALTGLLAGFAGV